MRRDILSNSGVRVIVCALLTILLLTPFVGCGSGTQTGKQTAKRGKGTAVFTLKWPERQKSTRLVPIAANWVSIAISDTANTGGTVYGTPAYLQRPATAPFVTTATFTELPPGQFYATATAYPSDPRITPAPKAQAANSVALTIADNQTTTVNLTMNSTIKSLKVTETSDGTITSTNNTLFRLRNKQAVITVNALDTANPLDPAASIIITKAITFASSNTAVHLTSTPMSNSATLTYGGTLGTSTITVQETEANPPAVSFTLTYKAAILVADTANHRIIQMDDISGTNFTAYNSVDGDPYGITMDSQNRIYFTATTTSVPITSHIVRIDNISGANHVVDTLSGTNKLNGPKQIAITIDALNKEKIYVAEAGNNRVCSMDDLSGTNFASFTYATRPVTMPVTPALNAPTGVAISGGLIYISDKNNNRIVRTSKLSDDPMNPPTVVIYAPVSTVTNMISDNLGFSGPTQMAFDGTKLLVADTGLARIRSFDTTAFPPSANPSNYGTLGLGNSQFGSPQGVAVDSYTNRYFFADAVDNRIVRVDDISGNGYTNYGTTGSATGNFNGPSSIFVR